MPHLPVSLSRAHSVVRPAGRPDPTPPLPPSHWHSPRSPAKRRSVVVRDVLRPSPCPIRQKRGVVVPAPIPPPRRRGSPRRRRRRRRGCRRRGRREPRRPRGGGGWRGMPSMAERLTPTGAAAIVSEARRRARRSGGRRDERDEEEDPDRERADGEGTTFSLSEWTIPVMTRIAEHRRDRRRLRRGFADGFLGAAATVAGSRSVAARGS